MCLDVLKEGYKYTLWKKKGPFKVFCLHELSIKVYFSTANDYSCYKFCGLIFQSWYIVRRKWSWTPWLLSILEIHNSLNIYTTGKGFLRKEGGGNLIMCASWTDMANKSWSVGQTSTTTKHGSVNYWINNFYTSLVILFIWNLADLRINSYGLFSTQQSIDHEPRPPPQNSLPFYIYNTNVFIWPPPTSVDLLRPLDSLWCVLKT